MNWSCFSLLFDGRDINVLWGGASLRSQSLEPSGDMSLGQNLRQKRQFCLQGWTVGHQAVRGCRDGAGLQAQEGSSLQPPARLLPTLPEASV